MSAVLSLSAARNASMSLLLLLCWAVAIVSNAPSSAAFMHPQGRGSLGPQRICTTKNEGHEPEVVESASPSESRRHFLAGSFAATVAAMTTWAMPTLALDMDAFMAKELTSTTTVASAKKLSDDEALCRFGQPSKARGDACVRAGLSTTLKKGGVDAYGNVDRGTYVRCQIIYVEDPNSPNKGFLMKKTVCE
jgi:hypothetical protein